VKPVGESNALVLLRLSGEVSTKARVTRQRFVTRLLRNARDALAAAGGDARIERHHDRVFVHLETAAGAEALRRVFGIQSLSLVERHPAPSLEAVVERGAALFAEAVRGRRFAVRARAVGGPAGPGLGRRDVERALGARLLPVSAGVDLEQPEVTAQVELFEGLAHYFTERVAAEGGLPLGTEGRAVALVSGGFDSPVASWQILRRGVALDYVFCNLGGASHQLGTLRVMKVIADRWSYGTRPRFHALDFGAVSRELQAKTERRYWQVLLKRQMLRAAERVAHERRAHAIVTGEALGQVSSQTLVNLHAISEAASLPVLRPLVGSNKDEIIALARRIGTAELSAVVGEYCSLVPRRPATAARLDVVRAQEARMDPAVLERAVAQRQVLDLRALDPEAALLPELEIDRVPDDACVLDLRSRAEYRHWHYPGAVQLDFAQALDAYPSFSKDQTYVLYCEYGLKSAHLAELMQHANLRAYHIRGGTAALRRRVEGDGPG
jgi:thiamine biosynthesis protein ThiI